MTLLEELIQYAQRCIADIKISEDEDYISCKKHKQACRRFLEDVKKSESRGSEKSHFRMSGVKMKLRES